MFYNMMQIFSLDDGVTLLQGPSARKKGEKIKSHKKK